MSPDWIDRVPAYDESEVVSERWLDELHRKLGIESKTADVMSREVASRIVIDPKVAKAPLEIKFISHIPQGLYNLQQKHPPFAIPNLPSHWHRTTSEIASGKMEVPYLDEEDTIQKLSDPRARVEHLMDSHGFNVMMLMRDKLIDLETASDDQFQQWFIFQRMYLENAEGAPNTRATRAFAKFLSGASNGSSVSHQILLGVLEHIEQYAERPATVEEFDDIAPRSYRIAELLASLHLTVFSKFNDGRAGLPGDYKHLNAALDLRNKDGHIEPVFLRESFDGMPVPKEVYSARVKCAALLARVKDPWNGRTKSVVRISHESITPAFRALFFGHPVGAWRRDTHNQGIVRGPNRRV